MFYMKKILILALLCVGIYWCFKSCIGCDSSEDENVTEEVIVEDAVSVDALFQNNAQYGNDYKKACEDLNFEAAHRILDKLDSHYDRRDAERYIFKKESIYLLSLNTEDAKQRILFLFKELELGDYDLSDIIKVVIEMDDVQFTKQLIELLQDGMLIIKEQDILNYLIKKKNIELSDIILHQLMLSKGSLRLPPKNEGIINTFTDNDCGEIERYNISCNKVFSAAIKNKNKYLAERVIVFFCRDYYLEYLPYLEGVGNRHKVSSSTNTIESAKAILQSALNSGTFD